jgi:NTE family protein
VSRASGLALALGGGGARGLAHVGVLAVLEREGLPVRAIAGSSMGGLIGAVWAAGIPAREIEREVLRLASLKELVKLVDVSVSLSGVTLKGARVYEYLAERLGGDLTFDQLRLPFAVVAVDVRSGRELVLREGSVVEAVRATISIPGVFAPVEKDGMRLVDGGVLDNVPVGVVRELSAGPVVAVDVLPSFDVNRPGEPPVVLRIETPGVPRMLQDSVHVHMIMVSTLTSFRLRETRPELVLRPEIPPDVSILVGFHRAEEVIAAGRAAAEAALPMLRAMV